MRSRDLPRQFLSTTRERIERSGEEQMFEVRGGGQVRDTEIERGIAAAVGDRGCGGGKFVWRHHTLCREVGATFVIVYLA